MGGKIMDDKVENKNIDEDTPIKRKTSESDTCGVCPFCESYSFGKAFCNYHRRETRVTGPSCFTDYDNK